VLPNDLAAVECFIEERTAAAGLTA
jgi:hypothetical protein